MKNKDEKKWDDIPEGYEEYTDDDFIDDLFDEQDDEEKSIPENQRLTKEELKEMYKEACKEMDDFYSKMAKEAEEEDFTPEEEAFWNLIDNDEVSEEDKQKLMAERFGYMGEKSSLVLIQGRM